MADDLFIEIDGEGQIKVASPRLKAYLTNREGKWKPVPSTDQLLVFQKDDAKGQGQQEQSGPLKVGKVMLCGSIESPGDLIDVVTFVYTSKKTGVLVVLQNRLKKTVLFQDGDVRMATSNLKEDRLGAVLYRYGLITTAQLNQALKQVTASRKVGQVLVELGALTVHDLYTYVRKQIEEIFYSILLIRHAEFFFYKLEDPKGLPVQLNLSTHNLLMEGVRRIDEMSYFKEKVPSADLVPEICPETPPKKLEQKEGNVYYLIDGKRTIKDLARESRMGEFETTKILFHLIQMRYVRVREEHEVARGLKPSAPVEALHQVVETFNRFYRKIYAAVKSKGRHEELRRGLESFFAGSTSFASLYTDINVQSDGTLPPDRVVFNLEQIDTSNRTDFLYQGLNELLFFEMFTAGEALTPEDEKELHDLLNKIFRQTRA